MLLTDKASIAGLPEIIVEAAAETARSEDKEGWAFTLHAQVMCFHDLCRQPRVAP